VRYLLVLLAACGSQSSKATTTEPSNVAEERQRREELARRQELTRAHHKLESEQQDHLAATCTDAKKWAPQHCKPTCYPPEAEDLRANTPLAGKVEVHHHVCQRVLENDQGGPWFILAELDGKKLPARPHRGRTPKAHKKGTWQEAITTTLANGRAGKAPRGETFSVLDGALRSLKHPVTHEQLRCTTVAQYTTMPKSKLDVCGMSGKGTCEAAGNAAARGINLARYRLAEAAQLDAAKKDEPCRAAATEALATARGLPRWRQYAKLNVGEWTEGLAYKTRWDGVLDEDTLFALAPTLAAEAEALLSKCGLVGRPPTTPAQEHGFHSCP